MDGHDAYSGTAAFGGDLGHRTCRRSHEGKEEMAEVAAIEEPMTGLRQRGCLAGATAFFAIGRHLREKVQAERAAHALQ